MDGTFYFGTLIFWKTCPPPLFKLPQLNGFGKDRPWLFKFLRIHLWETKTLSRVYATIKSKCFHSDSSSFASHIWYRCVCCTASSLRLRWINHHHRLRIRMVARSIPGEVSAMRCHSSGTHGATGTFSIASSFVTSKVG